MQRYHRLRQEVADLLSDVDAVKEAQQSSEKLAGVSPAQLMEDVSRERRGGEGRGGVGGFG